VASEPTHNWPVNRYLYDRQGETDGGMISVQMGGVLFSVKSESESESETGLLPKNVHIKTQTNEELFLADGARIAHQGTEAPSAAPSRKGWMKDDSIT